ncbi:glycosyltransferase family 4 protein [Nesterenkonia salmonea]|uniref:D-inositol 3-phosphate glycosyltransferase n=2 Tax=Nesterenkonia salmonea TaxID=1804987 RepID=A0A5R9BAR5_9MICC|nr:glycosyltransferase family 4 protein [Nesterenkonia salmonea]
MNTRTPVALAHDYLTQRGGAERVAAIMASAFPDAPLFTSLYDPDGTFDDFRELDVRTSALNRIPLLRRNHRLALPFLAPGVSTMKIDADVVLASSSGWAHAMPTTGKKVVYCHAPARWLYQKERYLGSFDGSLPHKARHLLASAALGLMSPSLRAWDTRRALEADRYLVNSTVVREAVADAYGIEAEVLPPPPAMDPEGPTESLPIKRPFVLCVARLLPYKNVDAVIRAVQGVDGLGLVVVGRGPDEARLRELTKNSPDSHVMGGVSEEVLRWLYSASVGLVASSFEDFGLTPLEAAAFGKPTAALHAGGYLDTIDPEVNGVFFEDPSDASIRNAISVLIDRPWDRERITAHSEKFGKARFVRHLQDVVASSRD